MFVKCSIKGRRKASGLLLFTLVSIAISAVVAIGLTKMNEQNFRVASISNEHMQARHYAQERADIIRASSFASLSGIPKTVIGGAGFLGEPFYEEVIETVSGVYKDYKINIYKGDNDKVLFSLVVHRADPKVLVDGVTTDSSDADSANSAMTAHASQELVGSKISAGVDSDSADTTMSAKVFKEYLNSVLRDYQLNDSIVRRPEGEAVGGPMRPVYVAADGFVKVTNADYRFNEDVTPINIGILDVDSNGHFYMDYQDKATFFKNEAK